MIGEDDGPVALGDASHGHVEDTVRSLDVVLLQPETTTKGEISACMRTEKVSLGAERLQPLYHSFISPNHLCAGDNFHLYSAWTINVATVAKYFLVTMQ